MSHIFKSDPVTGDLIHDGLIRQGCDCRVCVARVVIAEAEGR